MRRGGRRGGRGGHRDNFFSQARTYAMKPHRSIYGNFLVARKLIEIDNLCGAIPCRQQFPMPSFNAHWKDKGVVSRESTSKRCISWGGGEVSVVVTSADVGYSGSPHLHPGLTGGLKQSGI